MFILVGVPLFFGLSPDQPAAAPHPILGQYDFEAGHPASVRLPAELREASGLATTPDGRLFCHNDERGAVYQIDPLTGAIVKSFSIGEKKLRDDFEGIAFAESLMCLVTSSGDIHAFEEAGEGERVPARVYRTGLGHDWDIEGLCYDSTTRSLLLGCKENPLKKKFRYVYSFSLRTHRLESTPRFIIDRKRLEKEYGITDFRPTSIERHPQSGSFIILSSSDPAVIEVSASGTLLAARHLNRSVHAQPEGLAVGPDLTLYICNEGKEHGTLVRYPFDGGSR